ncbi:MAG: helix-turn-helix domain-containing protein [Clostridia bacterium]|nr:helix-turn-helix domain-containing protein [Clostridia bacterium]
MDAQVFGKFIEEQRKNKGLTQKALADKIMVTDKAISRWENGHGFPGIEMLEPLSEALGVSLQELMHSQIDTNEVYTKEDVEKLLAQTIQISVSEKLRERRKKTIFFVASVFLVLIILFLLFVGIS